MIRKPYSIKTMNYGEIGIFQIDTQIFSIVPLDDEELFTAFEVKLEENPTHKNIDGLIQFYGIKKKED